MTQQTSQTSQTTYNKPANNIQENINRNRSALLCLQALQFPMTNIRLALVALNDLSLRTLADGQIGIDLISKVIRHERKTPKARQLVAQKLNLTTEELFNK